MIPLIASEVAAALDAELPEGKRDIVFTGVSTDTRTIHPGDLFFALKGGNFDGHDFVLEAFLKGAAGAVVSREIETCTDTCGEQEDSRRSHESDGRAIIRVADTLAALGDLAAFYRRRFDLPVVAVTGSVGKTTTKEMIAAVLGRRFRTLKNELNFNNEIGVPLALFQLNAEHRAAVLEMAMRLPGEIARLAEIAQPTVGVITNIGLSHVERLGSIEAIAAAKAELLRALPARGLAVLPADERFFEMLLGACGCRAVSFGLSGTADVRGRNVEVDAEGRAAVDVSIGNASLFRLRLPTLGEHNVLNALAAAAVGWQMGIGPDEIRRALEEFSPPEQRASVIHSPQGFVVFDDSYNASPASMAAALSTLLKMSGERKIAVLGDMLELGEYAADEHREIGRLAARSGVFLLVTVGQLAKSIAEGAKEAGLDKVESVLTSEDAAELAAEIAGPGDIILVKGSHAMGMEKVVARLVSA